MEPRLTTELEDANSDGWSVMALRELARQLGVGNDFYYPLLGAARLLEMSKSE